jgi:hypothetical protein
MRQLVYEYVSLRVARLIHSTTGDLIASAAVISGDGTVATVAHAIWDLERTDLTIDYGGAAYPVAEIIQQDQVDVAIITPQRTADAHQLPHLVVSAAGIDLGRRILVYGWPARSAGKPYFRLTEIGSGHRIQDQRRDVDVLGFADRGVLAAGMSGCPVVDADSGELIGLAIGFDKTRGLPNVDVRNHVVHFPTERLDDYFVPVTQMSDRMPRFNEVATVNQQIQYMSLIDEAVDALRLLGFDCTMDDPMQDQRYVVRATLRLGPLTLRVLALAIDEAHEGQDRTSFARRVSAALTGDVAKADKVIAVHEILSDSVASSDYGVSHDVALVRSSEILTQLIDISNYLDGILRQWDQDRGNVAERYVPLSASLVTAEGDLEIPDLESWFSRWAVDATTSRKLLILGPVGSGKTTLVRRLSYLLAREGLAGENHASPLPIWIRLRDVRSRSLEHVLSKNLHRDLRTPSSDLAVYEKLAERGRFLTLLDGLDEMSNTPQRTSANEHMREILSLVRPPQKMVLTSRLEYFVDDDDITAAMASDDFRELAADTDFDLIVLHELDDARIDAFLRSTLTPERVVEAQGLLGRIDNLRELARRPMLLDLICTSLTTLAQQGDRASLATLYKRYVDDWLSRDLRVGRSSFPREAKEECLELIAVHMNEHGTLSISYHDVLKILTKYLGDMSRAAYHLHDVLANSLLARNDSSSTYEFAHKSFFEFMLATRFRRDLIALDPYAALYTSSFGARRLGQGVTKFMIEMESETAEASLWRVLEQARYRDAADTSYVAGNAVSLLRLLKVSLRDRSFDDTAIYGGLFSGADLTGSSFRRALLFDCGFVNCILDNVDMTDADVNRSDFKPGKVIYSISTGPAPLLASDNSAEHGVTIWELDGDSLNVNSMATLAGHRDDVFMVQISPSGSKAVSVGQDQSLQVWDLARRAGSHVLRGHVGDIRSAVFLTESLVATCSMDGQLILWNLDARKIVWRARSAKELWGLAHNRDGTTLVTGALNGDVDVWDVGTGTHIKGRNFAGEQPRRHVVAVTFDGARVMSGAEDGSLTSWDIVNDSWQRIGSYGAPVKSIATKADGSIATGHEDGTVVLWTKEFRPGRRWRAHDNYVSGMVFPLWAEVLITCSPDGTIALWDVAQGLLRKRFSDNFPSFQFSCVGMRLHRVRNMPPATREMLVALGAES